MTEHQDEKDFVFPEEQALRLEALKIVAIIYQGRGFMRSSTVLNQAEVYLRWLKEGV